MIHSVTVETTGTMESDLRLSTSLNVTFKLAFGNWIFFSGFPLYAFYALKLKSRAGFYLSVSEITDS